MTNFTNSRNRKRFVTSADYLRQDPEFLADLVHIVNLWNRDFPHYRISRRSFPPCEPWQPDQPFPFPPLLQREIDKNNRRLDRTNELLTEDVAQRAPVTSWAVRIMSLCQKYWPPLLFPPWTGADTIPTRGFVAGCLISDPQYIDPELWIPRQGIPIQTVRHDAIDQLLRPSTMLERLRYDVLVHQLRDAIETGQTVTSESLHMAEQRAVEVATHLVRPAPGGPPALLPLFADMSSQDFRNAEQSVLMELSRHRAFLSELQRAYAHHLARQGRRGKEIAGRLGVTTKTIERWLSDRDPGPTMTLPD